MLERYECQIYFIVCKVKLFKKILPVMMPYTLQWLFSYFTYQGVKMRMNVNKKYYHKERAKQKLYYNKKKINS